jgi:hypothetical protein
MTALSRQLPLADIEALILETDASFSVVQRAETRNKAAVLGILWARRPTAPRGACARGELQPVDTPESYRLMASV